MVHQRPVAQRLPGHHLDQFPRPVALPLPVNLLRQPCLQRLELTGGKLRVHIPQVCARLLEKLRGAQIAQGIRRKISDQPAAPVNILQTALRVVRRINASYAFSADIPVNSFHITGMVRISGCLSQRRKGRKVASRKYLKTGQSKPWYRRSQVEHAETTVDKRQAIGHIQK